MKPGDIIELFPEHQAILRQQQELAAGAVARAQLAAMAQGPWVQIPRVEVVDPYAYRCERCGHDGGSPTEPMAQAWFFGNAEDMLCRAEVEHALAGCNGRLEWVNR